MALASTVYGTEGYATLLSYVRDATLRDLIEVTWETACRPQESLRAEARHVDMTNQRWVFEKSESKGKRVSRVVYMSDKAMAIVKRLTIAHPTGPLFCRPNGKPWTPMSVNTAFSNIQVRMGKHRMKAAGEEIAEDVGAEHGFAAHDALVLADAAAVDARRGRHDHVSCPPDGCARVYRAAEDAWDASTARWRS